MPNQNRTACVETRGSQPRRSGRRASCEDNPALARIQSGAAQFELTLRNAAIRMTSRCTRVPKVNRETTYDLKREEQRAASVGRIAEVIIACLEDPSLSDVAIECFVIELETWMRAYRPQTRELYSTVWSAETMAEAPANVEQGMALRYVETRDIAGIERTLDVMTVHMAIQRRAMTVLACKRNEILFEDGHRRLA